MDLKVLNDMQKQAVTAPLGPVLVLAGAGSGKTRVLTYRIAYLIEQGLISAEHILALTFTNKAAKEMKNRVYQLVNPELNAESRKGKVTVVLPTLGTFHSVCAKILRKEIGALGYSSDFIIFDSDDQLKILREICDELEIGKRFPPSLFRAYIGMAKNNVQTPTEFNIGLDNSLHDLVQSVYSRYQNYLYSQNAVDFDDLLMLVIKLLSARPDMKQKYQQLFQYILVDEYQDTNPAQYALLQLLISSDNIFVVGDDAQSIYGFRGSTIANILNFEKDYPKSLVIKLEQNYRSSKNILAVADRVIALNSEQKPKKLWTENDDGPKVSLRQVQDERAESFFVARTIIRSVTDAPEIEYEPMEDESGDQPVSILDRFLQKQRKLGASSDLGAISSLQLPLDHKPLDQFAVLYRTHAQSRSIEEALISSGIPYQIIGGLKFYERKEIKDMLAYLRLVMNFRDLVSLKRVINEPARGIGDKSYQVIKKFILDFASSPIQENAEETITLPLFRVALEKISLPAKQHQGTKQFFQLIESFGQLALEFELLDLMELIFKKTGMEVWLDDGTESGATRVDNVRELFTVATKFSGQSWKESLPSFLEEVALVTDIDSLEHSKDAVTLMTLHSAKGLEFDTVFFVGLEEGVLPHSRSLLDPTQLAEEVRLAYVGVTRARKQLYLVYAQTRQLYGTVQTNSPSRILAALPQEHVQSNNTNHLRGGDGQLSYEAMPF
jgi:DNA helicase-2/ATP-dependent DNA helicase PcrA